MEALGQLTGGIAHDFNNLLQVMVGYLELIDAGLSKPEINTPKLRRNIDNARAAADRAAALTQQLLSFSRKQRLEGRLLNLNDVVRSLRGARRPDAGGGRRHRTAAGRRPRQLPHRRDADRDGDLQHHDQCARRDARLPREAARGRDPGPRHRARRSHAGQEPPARSLRRARHHRQRSRHPERRSSSA